jgi:DNA-binding CsgD family transcriptional regulator
MSFVQGRFLDATQVLFDLQQANEIAQAFSGCLEPDAIAHCITDGLVDRFQVSFARIWLMEPDQAMLRLVASSGMYTRTDGFFGRVPVGAYKVGKIAQNRVSFLSNNLAAEPWVGNREWAIANQIRGFAGYPLVINDRVIGVLAMFSHQPLNPEFLEVLQTLCTIATIALDTALQYQKEKQTWQTFESHHVGQLALSDQLAKLLSRSRLTLLGTEQPLSMPIHYLFLKTAEHLHQWQCTYARLIYSDSDVVLEAIVPSATPDTLSQLDRDLADLHLLVTGLGGTWQTQPTPDQRLTQIFLTIPYQTALAPSGLSVEIACQAPALQLAFTHLAIAAGLTIGHAPCAPLITDDADRLTPTRKVIWISQGRSHPVGILAKVDLSIPPVELAQVVAAVTEGKAWGISANLLSDRELEILELLTQGHRDRDIANRLIISESTVKFHLNNVLSKLQARTRYQAIYQAIAQGWI